MVEHPATSRDLETSSSALLSRVGGHSFSRTLLEVLSFRHRLRRHQGGKLRSGMQREPGMNHPDKVIGREITICLEGISYWPANDTLQTGTLVRRVDELVLGVH